MNYLLAASLPLLIFALGTATSIATTKALQDWAVARLDVRASTGELLAVALMLAGGAVSASDGERVDAASLAGTNGRRCGKRTGTGGRVGSNDGALGTGSGDTWVGSAIRIGRDCSVARGGTNTCALATLAVVASSPRARNLIFI